MDLAPGGWLISLWPKLEPGTQEPAWAVILSVLIRLIFTWKLFSRLFLLRLLGVYNVRRQLMLSFDYNHMQTHAPDNLSKQSFINVIPTDVSTLFCR
jgi:hypothetical protein